MTREEDGEGRRGGDGAERSSGNCIVPSTHRGERRALKFRLSEVERNKDRDRKGDWSGGEKKMEKRRSTDESPVFKIPVRLRRLRVLPTREKTELGNAERGQIGVAGADRKGVVVAMAVAVVWRKLGEGLQSGTDCRGDK